MDESPASTNENQSGDEGLFEPETVIDLLRRVNNYQREHPAVIGMDRGWIRATWYTGVMAAYRAGCGEEFLEQALQWGKLHDWQPGDEQPAGCNRLTCTQTWFECYFETEDDRMIEPTIEWLQTPHPLSPAGDGEWWEAHGTTYVDAAFVGPPALAMAYQATGEERYLDDLQTCFWTIHDRTVDEETGLFYRDHRYRDRTNGNNNKLLWSRGNGWMAAAIPRLLTYLPQGELRREEYATVLKRMAPELAQRQGSDGLWRTNLDDPDTYPMPETSGTAFFCYALAWGINAGLLDKDQYWPVVRRAWAGLVECISDAGRVGWCQTVDSAPGTVREEDTQEYGTGAVLLAGSAVLSLLREE